MAGTNRLSSCPMDTRSPEQRHRIMAAVRQRNTGPELQVRRLVHRLGYRFRLHRRGLPGKPDVVFPSRKKAIFVHGCFWHGHEDCTKGQAPKSRHRYWLPKLSANRNRDARNLAELRTLGWHALVVWQCQLREVTRLERKLDRFLRVAGPDRKKSRGNNE